MIPVIQQIILIQDVIYLQFIRTQFKGSFLLTWSVITCGITNKILDLNTRITDHNRRGPIVVRAQIMVVFRIRRGRALRVVGCRSHSCQLSSEGTTGWLGGCPTSRNGEARFFSFSGFTGRARFWSWCWKVAYHFTAIIPKSVSFTSIRIPGDWRQTRNLTSMPCNKNNNYDWTANKQWARS